MTKLTVRGTTRMDMCGIIVHAGICLGERATACCSQHSEFRVSQAAPYEATLWYHHGKQRMEGQDIEFSHTDEHVVRECQGQVMQVSEAGGYARSTFEPLAQPGEQE